MCVAYPGRVETIEGAHGIVNFSGNKVRVNLSMVSVETGDYVLVHAGMAIQKVEKKEALDWIGLFKEIEELRTRPDCVRSCHQRYSFCRGRDALSV